MAKIPYPQDDKRAGRMFPALNLARKDPNLAAVLTKAVPGIHPIMRDNQGNRKPVVENAHAFFYAAQKRARRNADGKAVLKLMPDLALAGQILTSSILSPKDMMAADLIYTPPDDLFSSDLSASAVADLKSFFEKDLKINSQLSDILKEALIEKGSYPVAVFPENAIDQMINGARKVTTEALRSYVNEHGNPQGLGLLGSYEQPNTRSNKPGLSFESFNQVKDAGGPLGNRIHYYDAESADYKTYQAEEYLSVTDNPAVLKFSKLKDMVRGLAVQDAYQGGLMSSALEDHAPINDFRVEQTIFRRRSTLQERVSSVPHPYELPRKSVGNPLIMKFPTESVIPVHVPGNPKIHIGYFVLLDDEGNPIEAVDGELMQAGLNRSGNGTIATNLMTRVETNLSEREGFNPNSIMHMKEAYRIYADLVERDLISRIKNGRSAANVSIARNEEVYRLMLSRVLAQRYTQLLYVPVEYMTYIAFTYGDDGLGESILDQQTLLNTVRSVLLFSKVMAQLKNSIGRTKVHMEIDADEPNPDKVIEHAMDIIVRGRTLNLPLGYASPPEIMGLISAAGYEWDFQHPGLPQTKFEFTEASTNYAKPDAELEDYLRKTAISGFGVSAEMVDNGFNTEFATTAVANNVLFAKRVIALQDTFCPQLTSHLQKVAVNTEKIVKKLKQLFEDNFDKINLTLDDIDNIDPKSVQEEDKKRIIISHALHRFLNGFHVTLPTPSSVTMESQMKELQDYSQMLDIGLDSYFTTDLFNSATVGQISNDTTTVRTLYKGYFMRQFMAEKNILADLSIITEAPQDMDVDQDVVKAITAHLRAVSRVAVKSMIDLKSNADAGDKDLKAAGVDVTDHNNTSMGGGDMGGGASNFGGGDMGGFSMGADDLGGSDLGGGLGDLASDGGVSDLGTDASLDLGTGGNEGNPDDTDALDATEEPVTSDSENVTSNLDKLDKEDGSDDESTPA